MFAIKAVEIFWLKLYQVSMLIQQAYWTMVVTQEPTI